MLFNDLSDWSKDADSNIRYYSGKVAYTKTISYHTADKNKTVWLNIGKLNNIAEVFLNGISCGIVWTAPFRVDISKALKEGENTLSIEVVNSWNNRLVGDSRLSPEKKLTSTNFPFKMEGKPLLPAGLLGPVLLETSDADKPPR